MEEENEINYDDLFSTISQIKAKNSKSKPYKGMGILASEMVSTYRGENTGLGKSKYDEGMNWDVSVDNSDISGSINEYRAQNQPWTAKTGAGLGRIVVKAGSEIAKIPGYIGGGIAALGADENEGMETFVNNSWVKAINNFNEEVNSEYLPVYVKKAVSEGNLWDNITSIDFWATDGADGIGFIASMLAPGAILKSLSVGNKLSKVPGLAGRMSAQTGDVITATVANTAIESAAEAQGAMTNFDKSKPEFIKQMIDSGISPEEAELKFTEQKARLGRDIFVSNLAILAVPNAIQSSMLWGKGINKTASKILDSDGKLLSTVIEPKLYQKVLNRGKNVLGATVSEGFIEEAGQSTVENMFSETAKKGQLTDSMLNDFNLNELGNAYLDTISSTDGQKAMFLGAFLGGGMSAYHGAKQDIADRKATQSLLDIGNNAIDSFYKVFQTDLYNEDGQINPEKLKEKFEAFGQIEQLNLMYNQAVQKQDKEALEKLRDLAATQLAYGFIMNDELGLDVLKEHLNQSSKFDEIVQREQESGNKTSKEDIINNVMNKAKVLQKAYSNFNDFAPSLIDPELNNEQSEKDVLNFRNKLRSNYLTNKASIDLYENELKKLKEQRANILEDLDLDSNLVVGDETIQKQEEEDSRLKQNKEAINEIETKLKRLKKLDGNFWNKNHLQKEFNRFTKDKTQLEKDTSKEKEQEADKVNKQINEATSVKDLDEITTDNPVQQKEIEVKKQKLEQEEDNKLQEELDTKKEKEVLIKNQDFNSLREFDDAFDPISGKHGVVMQVSEDNIVIQTEEGEMIQINKPKVNTDNISSDEETVINKEDNEEISSKSNFSLPSKFNDTFKSFVDFMMKPFNKKGLETNFELNIENLGTNSQNAVEIYNQAINGKILSIEDKNLLYNWLPISININGNKSWTGYPGGKGDYSNPESKFTIRKNIVDAISQGISLENIKGKVAGQSSPNLNCKFENEKPVKNNVLNIDYLRELTNNGKDLSKLEIYHVDNEGKLIPVSEGAEINPSAKTKELLSTGKGNIYVTIKGPLGNDVPVKLNFNRLGEQLATPLLDIYKYILTHADKELLYTQSLSDLGNEDSQFYDSILYENLKVKLKGAIKLLGGKENEITLEQLIETMILEDSGSNSHLKIVEDENGEFALEFKEGNRYYLNDLNDPETLEVLTKNIAENKYRNIITIPNKTNKTNLSFKNEEYLKYIFETKGLTTNVSTTSHSFKSEEATIWLEPGVTTTKQVKPKTKTKAQLNKTETSDIEAKKADIERRRQESIKSLYEEKGVKILGKQISSGGWLYIINDGGIIGNKDGDALLYLFKTKEEALSNLNAKYDAELAALEEVKPATNIQTEIDKIENKYNQIIEKEGLNVLAPITLDERGLSSQEIQEGRKKQAEQLKRDQRLKELKQQKQKELAALESKPEIKNEQTNGLDLYNQIIQTNDPILQRQLLNKLFPIVKNTPELASYFSKEELENANGLIKYLTGARGELKTALEKYYNKPELTNAFGTNPNFKATKIVVDPETGETVEVVESLEDLQKQLEIEVSNRDKAPIAKLKAVFEVRIKEIEEKIRNIQNNFVSLQNNFVMEIEKEGTQENKEVKKAKVKNNLSKAEQLKEIEQMTQLNNMLLLNSNLPQQIKDKFEELKNKYSDEFNKLPKKCN